MQLNFLIVEDEELELNALDRIVRENIPCAKAVQLAGNGDAAMECIQTFSPNIVLMDIHIGHSSGIDLSRAILEQDPDARIIIVTAHDHFAYVQQALTMGVADYLLKPISAEKILASINKQIDHIEKQRTLLLQKMQADQNLAFIRQVFLSTFVPSAIHGTIDDKAERILADLNYPLSKIVIFVAECSMDGHPRQKTEELVLKKLIVDQIEQQAFDYPLLMDYVTTDHITICAFFLGEVSPLTAAQQLRRLINTQLHVAVRFGISNVAHRISELPAAYKQAVASLYMGSEIINQYHDFVSATPAPESQSISIEESCRQLSLAILSGDEGATRRIFEEFLHKNRLQNNLQLKPNCFMLWLSLRKELEAEFPLHQTEQENNLFLNEALSAQSPRGIAEVLQESVLWLYQQVQLKQKDNVYYIIRRVLHYMEENYASPLTLQTISADLRISPYYLCHIFKESQGIGVIEYLNEMRIKKAKALLNTEDASITEVAAIVGFHEANYFCRVFKKKTGLTPSAYKKLQAQKGL